MAVKGVNYRVSATNAAGPALQQFQNQLAGVQRATQRMAPTSASWNRGLSENRRAVQQLGFQMTDFTVQIAGGQNAMLAFIQQGGQILQVFGPVGAVLATLLTVFGTLALVFVKTGKSLAELTPLAGMFEGEVRLIASAIQAVIPILTDFARLVVNNLDVIIGTAAIFAGAWVASMIKASTSVQLFMVTVEAFGVKSALIFAMTTAVQALGAALMRLLPVALIAGLVYLVKLFVTAGESTDRWGNAMSNTGPKIATVADATQRLSEISKGLADTQTILDMKAGALIEKYGLYAAKVREVAVELEKLQIAEAKDTLAKTMTEASSAIGALSVSITGSRAGVSEMASALAEVQAQFGVTGTAAQELVAAFTSINNAVSFEDRIAAFQNLSDVLARSGVDAAKLPGPIRDAMIQAGGLVLKMSEVAARTEDAGNMAGWLATQGPKSGWLSGAISDASKLNGVLSRVAGWATQIAAFFNRAKAAGNADAALETFNLAGQYAAYGEGQKAMREAMANLQYAVPEIDVGSGNGGGGGGGGGGLVEKVKEEADAIKKVYDDLSKTISSSLLSGFKSVLNGTKSLKDAAIEMLNTVLDKVLDILLTPIFDNIAGSIAGGIGKLFGFQSFDGGGFTGGGSRSGGMDGKGGFMAMLHPNETVIDHTRGGGRAGGGGGVVRVMIEEAPGFAARVRTEAQGVAISTVQAGLAEYDSKVLPSSMARVGNDPDKR